MAKNTKYIKPLMENEYTDFEENGFCSADDLSEDTLDTFSFSSEYQALDAYDQANDNNSVKMFSFNESEMDAKIVNSNINTQAKQIVRNENPKAEYNSETKTQEIVINKAPKIQDNASIKTSISNAESITKIRGLTPKVHGESFSIKRCYQFRPSTLKKLNKLKAESDDFNIYLNEIIDAAICVYYDSVFNDK